MQNSFSDLDSHPLQCCFGYLLPVKRLLRKFYNQIISFVSRYVTLLFSLNACIIDWIWNTNGLLCLFIILYVKSFSLQFEGNLIKRQFLNNYSLFGAVTGHKHEGIKSLKPDMTSLYDRYLKIIIIEILWLVHFFLSHQAVVNLNGWTPACFVLKVWSLILLQTYIFW